MFRDLCSRLCYFAGVDTVHGRQLTVIIAAVFLDMLAVSFFVPLLPFYWKQLGIRPELLGFVSSVYSLSQVEAPVMAPTILSPTLHLSLSSLHFLPFTFIISASRV